MRRVSSQVTYAPNGSRVRVKQERGLGGGRAACSEDELAPLMVELASISSLNPRPSDRERGPPKVRQPRSVVRCTHV